MSCVEGTCMYMCPDDEAKMREKENLIHVLEVWNGGERQLVKCFRRSAADTDVAVPHSLRPFDVLMRTVHYLLLKVCERRDVPAPVVYAFVDDRLRAVRQDAIVQRLSARHCLRLLEPMIRFYVLYGYLLSGYPRKDFDPVLNKKHMLECVKWFLNCWDECNAEGVSDATSAADVLSRLRLDGDSTLALACHNTLVESVYILCDPEDDNPLRRYLTLPDRMRRGGVLQKAVRVAAASRAGNCVRALREADKLCPLSRCAFELHAPLLRRRALAMLSAAWGGGGGAGRAVPAEGVARLLRCTGAEAARAAQHYGMQYEASRHLIVFDKRRFDHTAPVFKPEGRPLLTTSYSLKDLLTYECQ